MAAPRRFRDAIPALPGPAVPMGRLRREALESLAQQARARVLRGQALRAYCFRIRAQLGPDAALDVALKLTDRG